MLFTAFVSRVSSSDHAPQIFQAGTHLMQFCYKEVAYRNAHKLAREELFVTSNTTHAYLPTPA